MHDRRKWKIYILVDLIVDESNIILLNIYAPNDINQQVTFFRSLQICARKYGGCRRLQLRPDGNRQEGRKLDFQKSSRYSEDQMPYEPV